MPLFEENNQKNNNQQTNQTDNCGFEQTKTNNQTQSNPNPNQKSGLMTIIGQLLPLAPFAFEQFTGQKVPHMTGTIAEMQMALINIQTNLQTIVSSQQAFNQRLTSLETNAVQQLTSLSQQFQSLRLTHTREKKEIEYNPRPELNTEDQNY